MRFQSSALVIALAPYSESSQIAQLLTREHGFVSALARGSHRDKSAYGGALDLLTCGRADLSTRRGSDLELLHAFAIDRPFRGLRLRFDGWLAAGCVIELLKPLAWPRERAATIFDLAITTLDLLDSASSRETIEGALTAFVARWLRCAGFEPRLDGCANCGQDVTRIAASARRFSSRLGGIACESCAARDPSAVRCPDEVWFLLRRLLLGTDEAANPSPRAVVVVRTMLDRFVEERIERPLTAARWFTDGVPRGRNSTSSARRSTR